jgi:hypothetical protein
VTSLYPQKLTLTSLTGGGRSVGIVRSRTKATEFVCFVVFLKSNKNIAVFVAAVFPGHKACENSVGTSEYGVRIIGLK